MAEAEGLVADDLKEALKLAHANIEKFHAAQKFEGEKVETAPGVVCWQKSAAIEKVGLYIPGGTAPLFSTVLMLATPAKIAGCKEIVLCTPPNREGKVNPAILMAAKIAGVNRIFKAGGVQAIGAMAYGTESVPKVSKIFGPGNQFVMLAIKDYTSFADRVLNAGSVFLGNYSCESAGDYASGTNHTLPTSGYAKAYSGVNLDSFCRKITFQELTAEGIRSIGPAVERMAAAEQLDAHKNAMTVRLQSL